MLGVVISTLLYARKLYFENISFINIFFFSTLSSHLNSLACTTYEDFLKQFLDKKGFRRVVLILRLTVIGIGLFMLILVYVLSKYQAIYVICWTAVGMCVGPVMGLYMLGLFFPHANGDVRTILKMANIKAINIM